MKNDLAATTRYQRTHLLAAIQLITLTIFLAHNATAATATYNGLFSEIDGTNSMVNPLSSGFLTLSVRDFGTFSGKLFMSDGTSASGARYPLSGQFDAEGKDTIIIPRKAAAGGALTVKLQYAPAGQTNTITGQVSCTNWSAQLLAYQAYSSQPQAAGTYTVRFRPSESGNGPEGVGAGKVFISLAGNLTFNAKLPDGTSVSQSLKLCVGGRWPLYVSLYKGQGSLLGWLEFSGSDSLSGEIGWTKPAMPSSKYYNLGFTNVTDLEGLSYIPRKVGSRPVNFSKGIVVFSGGPLDTPFTNTVTVGSNGSVHANTSSALTFRIIPATGLFSGSAKLPGLTGRVQLSGAVFQAPNQGYGYFLANGQSGAVLLYGDYQ